MLIQDNTVLESKLPHFGEQTTLPPGRESWSSDPVWVELGSLGLGSVVGSKISICEAASRPRRAAVCAGLRSEGGRGVEPRSYF